MFIATDPNPLMPINSAENNYNEEKMNKKQHRIVDSNMFCHKSFTLMIRIPFKDTIKHQITLHYMQNNGSTTM